MCHVSHVKQIPLQNRVWEKKQKQIWVSQHIDPQILFFLHSVIVSQFFSKQWEEEITN